MPFVMLVILGALFYLLFIKGYVWKILLLTIVPYYGSMLLGRYIPTLSNTAFIITPLAHEHIEISWAFAISFVVMSLCVIFFGRKVDQ